MVRALGSLKVLVAVNYDRSNTAEAQAQKKLDKMFKPWVLVEGPNRTVGSELARAAGLVDAEFVCVREVITAAQLESEGTVSEAICNVHDDFPVYSSSDAPIPSAGGSPDQA